MCEEWGIKLPYVRCLSCWCLLTDGRVAVNHDLCPECEAKGRNPMGQAEYEYMRAVEKSLDDEFNAMRLFRKWGSRPNDIDDNPVPATPRSDDAGI